MLLVHDGTGFVQHLSRYLGESIEMNAGFAWKVRNRFKGIIELQMCRTQRNLRSPATSCRENFFQELPECNEILLDLSGGPEDELRPLNKRLGPAGAHIDQLPGRRSAFASPRKRSMLPQPIRQRRRRIQRQRSVRHPSD
jgi:hypothetical protein